MNDIVFQLRLVWSSRSPWVGAGLVFLVSVYIAFDQSSQNVPLSEALIVNDVLFSSASQFGIIFTLGAGVLAAGFDLRNKNIPYRLATCTSRSSLWTSWVVSAASVGAFYIVVSVVAAIVGASLNRSPSEIITVVLTGQFFAWLVSGILGAMLMAILGVGLATLCGSDSLALLAALIWVFLFENLLTSKPITPWLPWRSANGTMTFSEEYSLWQFLLGLIIWTALIATAGYQRFRSKEF